MSFYSNLDKIKIVENASLITDAISALYSLHSLEMSAVMIHWRLVAPTENTFNSPAMSNNVLQVATCANKRLTALNDLVDCT